MSDVTGSLVKSALDYHAATNPQSRFPVCRCGHSSMDVYRPRHLHEMVERLTGAVLMPTPLIGAPSASLMDLLTAAMVAASEQQRADLLPYTVVARSYVSAYAAWDDTPMLSRENIVGVLESSLDAHSVAEMTMSPEGGSSCGVGAVWRLTPTSSRTIAPLRLPRSGACTAPLTSWSPPTARWEHSRRRFLPSWFAVSAWRRTRTWHI